MADNPDPKYVEPGNPLSQLWDLLWHGKGTQQARSAIDSVVKHPGHAAEDLNFFGKLEHDVPNWYNDFRKMGTHPKPADHESKANKKLDKEFSHLEHTPLHDLDAKDLKIIADEAGRDNKTAKHILNEWNKIQPSPAKQISQMLSPFTKGEEALPQTYANLVHSAAQSAPSAASADAAAQQQAQSYDTYSPVETTLQPTGGNPAAGQSPLSDTGHQAISASIAGPSEQTDANANAMQSWVNSATPNQNYVESVLGDVGKAAQEYQKAIPYSSLMQTLAGRESYGIETATLNPYFGQSNSIPDWLQSLYSQVAGTNMNFNPSTLVSGAVGAIPGYNPATQNNQSSPSISSGGSASLPQNG